MSNEGHEWSGDCGTCLKPEARGGRAQGEEGVRECAHSQGTSGLQGKTLKKERLFRNTRKHENKTKQKPSKPPISIFETRMSL